MLITRRSGFSLIETLVVLAIGGMALAVIFSIGTKAGDTGFALGRRAMAAADADIAVSDARILFRSFELRPGVYFVAGTDTPLIGEAQSLSGPAVMQQATTCAPKGWSGQLRLAVEAGPEGRSLICYAGDRATPLLTWSRGEAANLSYSTDGLNWSDSFRSETEGLLMGEDIPEQAVFIRLLAAPTTEIVERLTSGRSELWARPDAP